MGGLKGGKSDEQTTRALLRWQIRGGVEVHESSAIAIACISYIQRYHPIMRTRWVNT